MYSSDERTAVLKWIDQIKKEKHQIKFLGNKTIDELKKAAEDKDNDVVPLQGLKNVWCTYYNTTQGTFLINIVQTDLNKL